MDISQLQTLVEGGEDDRVEFKSSTGQRSEGARAVCAMLNGGGGFVLFGVSNSGEIRGQEVSTKTLEAVVGELGRIEPQVLLHPEEIPVSDTKSVISVPVPGGTLGPYTYDGRPYVRHGPTTQIMPQEEYQRLLSERAHPSRRWETQPAHYLSLEDLDTAEVVRTVDEAIRRGRLNDPGTRDIEELLVGLGLQQEGRILNAAVALFGKEDRMLPYYPQCFLRMARFRGTTTNAFEDNRQFHGNAFQLIRRAQSFLRDHLPVAGRIVPDLFTREDDPLYPPEALREALANAFCHRDYQVGGGSVSIGVFDDRLEITNSGRLPSGLTVEDLTRPHPSIPWNPVIASVFYRRGLIEQWGRGTIRIAELTERAGLASPQFEERAGEVIVRFFPTSYVPPRQISHSLTELQQDILEVISEIGPARLSEIITALPNDPPERTVQDNLQTLRTLDLVKLRGRARGARWSLIGQ